MDDSPLELWWKSTRLQLRQERLQQEQQIPVPLNWSTGYPVDMIEGVRERPRLVLNLDKLHRRVFELLGVRP